MSTEPTLPPMPEVDLPEGDWFEKDLYVKKFAADYAKAALAMKQQAEPVLNGMERAFSSEAMSRRDERQGLPASQQQAEPVQKGGSND